MVEPTTFAEADEYPIAVLTEGPTKRIYEDYLLACDIPVQDVAVYPLPKGKLPVKYIKEFFSDLAPLLKDNGTKYIIVTSANYYKVLTGMKNAEANAGYVLPDISGRWNVLYAPNPKATFYNPELAKEKIKVCMNALISHIQGTYKEPGEEIIKSAEYLFEYDDIKRKLKQLIKLPALAVDTENFSLNPVLSGVGTISFSWNKHEGIAFPVDYKPIKNTEDYYGKKVNNKKLKRLLKSFFKRYTGRILYHNASYDVSILIYNLFMKDILDREGLLEGLEVMLKNTDCTFLISYLATNSTARTSRSLKELAQEFAGNYAVDEIKDIRKIPLNELLQYNLVDTLSTWFVYEKYWPIMVKDQQLDFYNNIFKTGIYDIIEMQLTGIPINMERALEVDEIFNKSLNDVKKKIQTNKYVEEYLYILKEKWVEKRNSTLKRKRVTLEDADLEFNPNSDLQVQGLIYDYLGMPKIKLTPNKQPATDRDTLLSLSFQTDDENIKSLFNDLLDYTALSTIINTFMSAVKKAVKAPDGWHYLLGNFKLGGTISGRLSSNNPNLQNLPGSNLSREINRFIVKLFKSCVQAPPGWLYVGMDFDSLEDKISALTTKDPNKLKVYIDGYDGHSLRAFYYFPEKFEHIKLTGNPEEDRKLINSIAVTNPRERQESKDPTFALTYRGTWKTLVDRLGWSETKAKRVEENYNELYKVSIDWVDERLDEASRTGFVTLAFGLRLRTPLLAQTVRGTRQTPREAEAEARSAGNALGQSWGLLNTRAGIEFNKKVRDSKYRLDIKPCAQVHDSQNHLIKDDVNVFLFWLRNLNKAVQWQEDPLIQHDIVKLSGSFSLYYPDWFTSIDIPNNITKNELLDYIAEQVEKNQTKKEIDSQSLTG